MQLGIEEVYNSDSVISASQKLEFELFFVNCKKFKSNPGPKVFEAFRRETRKVGVGLDQIRKAL
jgi:hypothetical protein